MDLVSEINVYILLLLHNVIMTIVYAWVYLHVLHKF